jgi:hypothetical protein
LFGEGFPQAHGALLRGNKPYTGGGASAESFGFTIEVARRRPILFRSPEIGAHEWWVATNLLQKPTIPSGR